MKILAMTATFGKLEGQTLTLQPGLNVVSAPNEWGKSTWCGFIVAMLYGIETSQRTSSKGLADKERYAPWSGKPMSGRMDILWNGRAITLERSSKGRSIFGVFRAYETESGLDVSELTAENCGQVLLGVEKSVFTRSAFLRFSDLPVTQDEALRRRLNALVTTGDETGESDKLAQKLKDLKNNCRHNKTGLIPQVQAQKAQLQDQLTQLDMLRERKTRQKERMVQLETSLEQLQNHKTALAYEAYRGDEERLAQAIAAEAAAAQRMESLQARCAALPAPDEARHTLEQLSALQEQLNAVQHQPLPAPPEPPKEKQPFRGLDEAETQAALDADLLQYAATKNIKRFLPGILIFLAAIILSLVLKFALPQAQGWCIPVAVAGFLPLLIQCLLHSSDGKIRSALETKYGTNNCGLWQTAAQSHIEALRAYRQEKADYHAQRDHFRQEQEQVQQQVLALTQGAPVTAAQKYWEQVLTDHRELENAQNQLQQTRSHRQTLETMVRQVPPPAQPDTLTLNAAQTENAIRETTAEYQQLQWMVAQIAGQMETLGSRETLHSRLEAADKRLAKLLRYEAALALAQQTLTTAANELQRRFAPKIAEAARQIFARITDGRYDRLILEQDLSLNVASREEDVLHGAQWRSDGTADQLYLALRLAVAAELTPDAPLVLDDALVRFDDTRLKAVLDLLRELSVEKQIILFSCQDREQQYI